MNSNNVNAQDFNTMKKVDQKYGDQMKVAKTAPKKVKEKHRVNYNNMSLDDIFAMTDDDLADMEMQDEMDHAD